MIVIRQKEFARAIPKELVVRELERRGLKTGVSKYVSSGYRTVKNSNYVKSAEAAWQKLQDLGKNSFTGNYKDLGINQRINLKGTLEHYGNGRFGTNLSTGGKFRWKNKKAGRIAGYADHPSRLLDGKPALKVAEGTSWKKIDPIFDSLK